MASDSRWTKVPMKGSPSRLKAALAATKSACADWDVACAVSQRRIDVVIGVVSGTAVPMKDSHCP